MQFRDSSGNIITTKDKPLSRGGEGSIYVVTSSNYPECCVKVFHKNKITNRINKLEYQVSHPLKAPHNSLYKICWPIDFVYINNERVGFVMPLAWPDSFSLYDIYLNDELSVFDRRSARGVGNRFKILFNIANAISVLHREGYVLGDFKPENILLSADGKISLIDLDSIQIVSKTGEIFYATAFTEDYAYPPELGHIQSHSLISSKWDNYSFAIVAYQILFGIHPFTVSTSVKDIMGNPIQTRSELMKNRLFPFGCRNSEISIIPPPHYYFYSLDDSLRSLFIETFNLENNAPSIDKWTEQIYRIITNDKYKLNEFRIRPHYPIIIVTQHQVTTKNSVELKWLSFFCDCITINGNDYSHKTKCEISYPKDGIIKIKATNLNHSNYQNLDFLPFAIYCVNCGNKFNNNDDLFCNNCGCKRLAQ